MEGSGPRRLGDGCGGGASTEFSSECKRSVEQVSTEGGICGKCVKVCGRGYYPSCCHCEECKVAGVYSPSSPSQIYGP